MINASIARAPPVGRQRTILGGGIFDRNYGDFSTGVDKPKDSRLRSMPYAAAFDTIPEAVCRMNTPRGPG